MADALRSPRVVAMRLVTFCRNPLGREARVSSASCEPSSIGGTTPTHQRGLLPDVRLAPSASGRQVLHFQAEGSLKALFPLSIQTLKTAGKRTCRLQVVEDLRAINTVRPHKLDIDRCCYEHAESGGHKIDPDSSPSPGKKSGCEAPGRVYTVARNRGRDGIIQHGKESYEHWGKPS